VLLYCLSEVIQRVHPVARIPLGVIDVNPTLRGFLVGLAIACSFVAGAVLTHGVMVRQQYQRDKLLHHTQLLLKIDPEKVTREVGQKLYEELKVAGEPVVEVEYHEETWGSMIVMDTEADGLSARGRRILLRYHSEFEPRVCMLRVVRKSDKKDLGWVIW